MSCGSELAIFSSDKTEENVGKKKRSENKQEESFEIAIEEKNTEEHEKKSTIPDADTDEDVDETSLRIEEVTDDEDYDTPENSDDNKSEEIMEPEIINIENGDSRDIEEGEIVEEQTTEVEDIELETTEPEEVEPEEVEPEEVEPEEVEPEEVEPEEVEPEEVEPEEVEPEEVELKKDEKEISAPAHPEIKQHLFSKDFSLDKLFDSIENTSYKSKIRPVFKAIENKVKKHEGGMWFLKESNGSGSQFFIEKIKKVAPDQSGVKVIVSEANLHEFDYILFINLIKELLSINSDGENTIK
ncbi:MAG: hypothetical protein R6W70_06020, partial [bacterium]